MPNNHGLKSQKSKGIELTDLSSASKLNTNEPTETFMTPEQELALDQRLLAQLG